MREGIVVGGWRMRTIGALRLAAQLAIPEGSKLGKPSIGALQRGKSRVTGRGLLLLLLLRLGLRLRLLLRCLRTWRRQGSERGEA